MGRKAMGVGGKRWAAGLGRRIRMFREERRITREKLAVVSGLSPNTILNAEKGRTGHLDTYLCLARHLDISPTVLLSVPDPLASRYGIRDLGTALTLFGYAAERQHTEVRVRPDGSGFAVTTVWGFHATWYEGPLTIHHRSETYSDPGPTAGFEEAAFQVLERPAETKLDARQLFLVDRQGKKHPRYEIDLPEGLGRSRLSYRYSSLMNEGTFPPCAELVLVEQDEMSDDEIPAVLVGPAARYATLDPTERRAFPGGYAAICCNQFPVESLLVTVRFPEGCQPEVFEPRCWSGFGPWDGAKALPEFSNPLRVTFDKDTPSLALAVDRPLMGVSYAVYWWPPRFADWWPAYKKFKGL